MDIEKLKLVYQEKSKNELIALIDESHHLEKEAIPVLIEALESNGVSDASNKVGIHLALHRKKESDRHVEMNLFDIREIATKILHDIKAGKTEDYFGAKLEDEYIPYYRFKKEQKESWFKLIRIVATSLNEDLTFSGDPNLTALTAFQVSPDEQVALFSYTRKKKKPLRVIQILALLAFSLFAVIVGIDESENWVVLLGLLSALIAFVIYKRTFKTKDSNSEIK